MGEYNKEMLLGFEKRYWVSTSAVIPWRNIRSCGRTASAILPGFALDEETGEVQLVRDQANAVIGGLIADKTVKYTKNDKIMAF